VSTLLVLALAGFFWWAYQQASPRGPTKKAKAVVPRRGTTHRTTKPEQEPPHEVLGVAPDASADEIRKAYQDKVRQYHPDRVAGAAPELQKLAERRTKELNAAYQALTREER
jgi:DnaJ-domain-containing protein 1